MLSVLHGINGWAVMLAVVFCFLFGGVWFPFVVKTAYVRALGTEMKSGPLSLVGPLACLTTTTITSALWEDANSGIPIIFHGGNMPGYISDIVILPSVNVGAVILTNGGNGTALRLPFRRRLLELLFDGRPEALEDVAFAARQLRATVAEERKRLVLPAYPAVVADLAHHYANAELGPLDVHTDSRGTRIVTNSFTSLVASRKNDDGSTSLETISPGMEGFQFIVGVSGGNRTLTLQDGQHIYPFEAN